MRANLLLSFLCSLLIHGTASLAASADEPAPAAAPAAERVRVATLVPYVGDALARVPDRAIVVATVRRSSVSPAPAGVIDLGSPHAPSFEKLAESNAQLVIGDSAMHGPLREKLGRGGAEVLLVDGGTVDQTLAGLGEVGRKVGASAEMDRAIADTRTGIAAAALAEPVATLPFFGAPGSFLVVTERTWLGDLLDKLNFQNLARASSGKESFPGYVLVGDEVLAGMQPALVLVVAHGDPVAIQDALSKRAAAGGAWRHLQAARLGVHVLDPARFAANPGLGLPEAARQLRRLVQPDVAAR